jgi:hypothetical protein
MVSQKMMDGGRVAFFSIKLFEEQKGVERRVF